MGVAIGFGKKGGSGKIKTVAVTSLPDIGQDGIIYLVPNTSTDGENKYEEYIWIKDESRFEHLGGGGDVDLDGYATEEWVQQQGYAKLADLSGYTHIIDVTSLPTSSIDEQAIYRISGDNAESRLGTLYGRYSCKSLSGITQSLSATGWTYSELLLGKCSILEWYWIVYRECLGYTYQQLPF